MTAGHNPQWSKVDELVKLPEENGVVASVAFAARWLKDRQAVWLVA